MRQDAKVSAAATAAVGAAAALGAYGIVGAAQAANVAFHVQKVRGSTPECNSRSACTSFRRRQPPSSADRLAAPFAQSCLRGQGNQPCSSHPPPRAVQAQAALTVTPAAAAKIRADFLAHMRAGLAQSGAECDTRTPLQPSLLMLPSWLSALPSGDETGGTLAVDFGGTSFRVMHAVLGAATGAVRAFSSPAPLSWTLRH